MSKIDLNYIGSECYLTNLLASKDFTLMDLVVYVRDNISNDLSKAQGYIDKYDNKYDRLEGTDVSPLKDELKNIEDNLKRLEAFQDTVKRAHNELTILKDESAAIYTLQLALRK